MAASEPPPDALELELARARSARTWARLNVAFCTTGILYYAATFALFLKRAWPWNAGVHALCGVIMLPALAMWLNVLRLRSRKVEEIELALEERAIAARAGLEGRYR